MKTKYELHPLCTLFPRMSGNDYQNLKDDIQENGLREPIIIHEGMILDGGNRYQACIDLGIEPGFMNYGGGNIVAYVLSANLHRRHLTPGQQAAIVSSAQDWAHAQTVGKPKSGNVTGLDTVANRTAQSGASDKTQRMADKVAKTNPELAKQVGRGEISLPAAIKSITPQKPVDQEQESIRKELYEEFNPVAELEQANIEIERITKIVESDEPLLAAMAEVKRLNALVLVLEERMRGFQSSENQAKKQAQFWKNKHDKLEKQMKALGLVEF